MYANSSRAAVSAKRAGIMGLTLAATPDNESPFPLSDTTVVRVAAALKRAGFRSAVQYLAELKLIH
eukprot:14090971-Heterocapsa_arctica.AAC.1